jgi:hypothetical protein
MHARFAGLVVLAAVVLGETSPQAGIAQVSRAPLPPVQVEVTGDPAPIETLRLAILTTARAVVPEARGGGQLSLSETAPPLQPLPAASEMALRAVVQVIPSGARPVTHTVPVDIKNEVLPWADAQALLVSNSPETLPFGKVLLNESVLAGQTVRLLYHHANGSPAQRMTIAVNLSNPDRGAITLWVTGAAGSSGSDELALGHAAARAFLDQYWHRAGFMVRVPGNTTLPLFLHDLAPGAIASGLTQLTLLDGDHVNIQVFARMDGEMDPPTMSYAPNFDKIHQRGSFDRPQFVHPVTYTVGGPLAMMSVGDDQDALRQSQTKTVLSGNYGVVYSFPVEVINPSPLPTILGLVMQAVGGQTSGTILIDDHIVDVPRIRSGERRLVSTIHVPAGEHRTVIISTMPESGANYPVRFTFGSQYQ